MRQLLVRHSAMLGVVLTGSVLACSSSFTQDEEGDVEIGTVSSAVTVKGDDRPNVLMILADDLGYSDIGVMGSEIDTPNLDTLVGDGRLLTNHHVGTVSAITRSMLMSGADHHQVGLGWMDPSPNPSQQGQPGYEAYLNESSLSLAEMLQDAGYHTYMAGKWHLCHSPWGFNGACRVGKRPDQMGFEQSYALLAGFDSNHYTDEDRISGNNAVGAMVGTGYALNGVPTRPIEVPLIAVQGVDTIHSSELFTRILIDNIDQGRMSDDGQRKPFFAYAAYIAPHWPLQAPDELIAKYEDGGLYTAGFEPVRQARIARLRERGLLPDGADAAPMSPPRAYYEGYEAPIPETAGNYPTDTEGAFILEDAYVSALHEADDVHVNYHRGVADRSWDKMNANERAAQAKYMAIYAAMVEHLDQEIGRLIDHLKEIGEYDNTLIMFHSDNGADGWPMNEDDPRAVDEWVMQPPPYAEEPGETRSRFERIGTAEQPIMAGSGHRRALLGLQYGRQWAEVSNTPLSDTKGFQSEGGIRTAAIMKLPGKAKARKPYTKFTHIMDNTATILDVAGVQAPSTPAPGEPGKVLYGDRAVFPIAGNSLVQILQSNGKNPVWRTSFGTESYSRAAMYSADGIWKALWTEPAFGPLDGHWELFRIEEDPGETNDLSAEYPDVVAGLKQEWVEYLDRVGGIYPLRPNAYYPEDPPRPPLAP